MNRTSIHFVGGGRIYVREDYATVRERLRNHGVSRGYAEFTRGGESEYRKCSVNIAQVTFYEGVEVYG